MMDAAGLDVVAAVEQKYVLERELDSEKTVYFLVDNYISRGKIGGKSPVGGFYERAP